MMASEQTTAFAMSLIQNKLNELVGQPSGYYDTLPIEVKKRVLALKNIQWQQAAVELEMKEEILALERKYSQKLAPFYEKRTTIISGSYEPTEVECKPLHEEDEIKETEEEEAESGNVKKGKESVKEAIKGIPEFWSTVLRSYPGTDSLITPEDEDVLKHLTDVRYSYLGDGDHGFRLEFVFSPNDYFENNVISKSYYLKKSEEEMDFVMDRCEASKIDWKEGKNLGVKVVTKTQRKPGTNKTRTIKKTIEKETFFHFFKSLSLEDEDDDEDDEEEEFTMEEKLQADFGLGDELKTRVIPKAVEWFTGEALEEYGDDEDDYDEDEYDDEDDEEGEGQVKIKPIKDDEDDDDDDDEAKPSVASQDAQAKPECKQQ